MQKFEAKIRTLNKLFLVFFITTFLCTSLSAQSQADSLNYFDPYTQFEDIRRILITQFTPKSTYLDSIINKFESEIANAEKENNLEKLNNILLKSADKLADISLPNYALKNYFRALEGFEIQNDSIMAAYVNVKIGRVYYYTGLKPTKDYFTKPLKTLKKSGNKEFQAFANYSEGVMTTDEHLRDKLFKKALEIQFEVTQKKPNDYEANNYLSRYLNANGREEEALEIAERNNNYGLVVFYLNNIGYNKVLEKDYQSAINIFERSLKICIDHKLKSILRNVYDNLARVYRLKGNWEKAMYYQTLVHYVEENLFSERYSFQAVEYEVKYETDKKEIENSFLKKEKEVMTANIEMEKSINFFLIISSLLVVFILGFVYLSRKKIKSAKLLLDQTHNEVIIQKQKLEILNNNLTISENNLNLAQATAKIANWELNIAEDTFTFSEQLPIIYDLDSELLKTDYRNMILNNLYKDDKEPFIKYFIDDLENSQNEEVEYRINVKKELRWIRAKRIVQRDSEGNVKKIFGTVQDITESKADEKIRIEIAAQQSFTKQLISSQEEERKRIAGEIHDGIGQEILLIKNRVLLCLKEKENNEFLTEQLNEINDSAINMLKLLREISLDLRPAHIERVGLTETIIGVIQRISDLTKIRINHSIENIDKLLPSDSEINFFRIVQEGFNNIVKHSGAKNAKIEISVIDNNISMNIIDDGKGFKLKSEIETPGGFGLNNMRNRVRILNGTINIISEAAKGTKLEITIPVAKSGK